MPIEALEKAGEQEMPSGPRQSPERQRPSPGGYRLHVSASFAHSLGSMMRQQRLVFAAVIAMLPVLLPLAIVFLSTSKYAEDAREDFSLMAEMLYVNGLAPLMAIFFATMLVGEDAEKQTIAYTLTRPHPRSAWVLGRSLAYMAVATAILWTSIVLTFTAFTTMQGFGFNAIDIKLLLQFCMIIFLALLGYGSIMTLLGSISRKPIIIGAIFLYGWQNAVTHIPGLLGTLTIKHYTDAMKPILANLDAGADGLNALEEFQRDLFIAEATRAGLTLIIISALLFAVTVFMVRFRQYGTSQAVGS